MLSQTNSIDLNTRHGNILGCAEVTHALYLYARQNGRYRVILYLIDFFLCKKSYKVTYLITLQPRLYANDHESAKLCKMLKLFDWIYNTYLYFSCVVMLLLAF